MTQTDIRSQPSAPQLLPTHMALDLSRYRPTLCKNSPLVYETGALLVLGICRCFTGVNQHRNRVPKMIGELAPQTYNVQQITVRFCHQLTSRAIQTLTIY
jgi:hypothetical protein